MGTSLLALAKSIYYFCVFKCQISASRFLNHWLLTSGCLMFSIKLEKDILRCSYVRQNFFPMTDKRLKA